MRALLAARRPPKRTKAEAMREWSERVHGPAWDEFRGRYWASPFTRKRCFVCRRGGPGARMELNHLTYAKPPTWWRVKPLCHACHRIETWATRKFRPRMDRDDQAYAHRRVTYGMRWAVNGLALAAATAVTWPIRPWLPELGIWRALVLLAHVLRPLVV